MKRWVGWLVLAILVALVVAYARTVDWEHTWAAVRGASLWYLGAAALVNLGSMVLKAVRWWVFLRSLGVTSVGLVLRAAFAGYALNTVLPANGGEAARIVFVARRTHLPSAPVVATVAWDRIFDVAGYVALIAAAALLFRLPGNVAAWRAPAALLLGGVVAVVVWLARRPKPTAGEVLAEHPPAGATMPARARFYVARVGHSLSALSDPRAFAWAGVLSVGGWVTQVITFDLGARAANLSLPLAGSVAALIAVNLGYALRLTPGNVGFFQVAYAAAVAAFGIDREPAIAAGLLIQAIQMVPVALVGLLATPAFVAGRDRPGTVAATVPQPPAREASRGPAGR
jgi:uncharacterized membrane protein YbhN (UPF0104 family)